jgi:cystathionine gamma-synthase
MPQWRDVTGYEEGDKRVTSQLALGYPRFVIHPFVRALVHRYADAAAALPFPSRAVAKRAACFVQKQTSAICQTKKLPAENLYLVQCATEGASALKAYWQHCGEIVSSRQAYAALYGGDDQLATGLKAKTEVKARLAQLAGCQPDQVWLFPTGMAAIACAQRIISNLCPNGSTAQFGFPYVDTWKLQQKFGPRAVFFQGREDELAGVRDLAARDLAAVFTEVPTNPLLHTPPVDALYALLNRAGVPLVVDNTLDSFQNLELLPHCDVMVTSLTKYFSGAGDVMGGALILNPASPLADRLHQTLLETYEDLLWEGDAIVLAKNSRDLAQRMVRIEHNALSLQRTLAAHPAVAEVFAPNCDPGSVWNRLAKPGCEGTGGLFSITLKRPELTPQFYDALPFSKGPSLGTNFTLACPYTLLAHYQELDWAKACGVSPHLIRISAGQEHPEHTCSRLHRALTQLDNCAEIHPNLLQSQQLVRSIQLKTRETSTQKAVQIA